MTNFEFPNDEPPMRHAIRSFVIRFSTFVILGSPLSALGHGAEFLSARLTLLPDAEVLLEITADYGGNPLIPDEATAREALNDPVRLAADHGIVPLSEVAAPSISQHENWAEFAPAAYLPAGADDQPHQLITAAWHWRSETPEIVFEMPKGKMHDVLLWTRDETNPAAPPKWMLLLAGDKSKAIAVHWTPWWHRWPAAGLGALMLAAGVLLWRKGKAF